MNLHKLDQSIRVKMARFARDDMTIRHEGRFFVFINARKTEMTATWVEVSPYSKKSCAKCHTNEFADSLFPFMRCSKCKAVYYCGTECQEEDWKVHRLICISP